MVERAAADLYQAPRAVNNSGLSSINKADWLLLECFNVLDFIILDSLVDSKRECCYHQDVHQAPISIPVKDRPSGSGTGQDRSGQSQEMGAGKAEEGDTARGCRSRGQGEWGLLLKDTADC